jgi:HEAT repeat protein
MVNSVRQVNPPAGSAGTSFPFLQALGHGVLSGRAVVLAATSLLLAAVAVPADTVDTLLKDGKYQEAYQTLTANGAADAAALSAAARALLRHALAQPNEHARWSALRVARLLDDPAIASAVLGLARDGARYERSLALEILANDNPAAYRDTFLHALESPYRTVRLRGLRALASLKDETLVAAFTPVLAEDQDAELRAFAARALGDTGSPSALPPLQTALDDEVSVVQEEAVRALVLLHDPTLSAALRRRLADPGSSTRARVIRLMALVPDPTLATDLAPYVADPDAEVRALAAGAILRVLQPAPGGS